MAEAAEARWYVAHTYSGYEKKVKADLEKTIENRHLEDLIVEVRIPTAMATKIKPDGTKKSVEQKLYPGYILVNMVLNDDTWYVVRNTRGVTGFVGPDGKPCPLTDNDIHNMGFHVDAPAKEDIDLEVGDTITVLGGAWAGSVAVIDSVNLKRGTVTVRMEMFGRETPVDLAFVDVAKL